jgi:hypothetical protein
MRNTGLRNPRANALICVAMFVGGAVSVLSGVNEMNALGAETPSSAAKIGIGLVVGTIFALGGRTVAPCGLSGLT